MSDGFFQFLLMKTFVNRPGISRADFDNFPFDENELKDYRTLQHYLQALLRAHPHDVDKLITCPPGESENDWIYSCFRQFAQELNYYAYEHREVATEPETKFFINGQQISCLSAAYPTPTMVPAIDYITQTIDLATQLVLDAKLFPGGVMDAGGRTQIETYCRRFYRIFLYSYTLHKDVFEKVEKQSHLCERFTRFGKLYSLLKPEDIFIPDTYWNGGAE
jgi:hypothetical protein